jgi:RNAse (barnase) inhibitor barstar
LIVQPKQPHRRWRNRPSSSNIQSRNTINILMAVSPATHLIRTDEIQRLIEPLYADTMLRIEEVTRVYQGAKSMTRTSQPPVQEWLQQGGELDHAVLDKVAVVNAANELGLSLVVADCDRARNRSAVLRAIAKAVDFPEFFGGNLDALYDCLCDTVLDQKLGTVLWLYKLHTGDPILSADAEKIVSVCADAADFARENGRCFAFVVEHAGKHPDEIPGVAPSPYGE